MTLKRKDVLAALPPVWDADLLPQIEARVTTTGVKVVVLDDDPTGTQTVHDVSVLMDRSVPSLEAAFADPDPVVYILTNTRSMPLTQAQALNREIARNLERASAATGRDFVIVSRSDSTLRGHYPGEVDALRQVLPGTFDGVLIIPFFIEGGRLTINDTHYVTDGDTLIPAAQTEYARDAVFGYRNSDLRAWVAEKHHGNLTVDDVAHITLDDLRRGGPEVVMRKLLAVSDGQVCVVNAAAYRDLEVFTLGLLRAEGHGKHYLYRTAASFVRVRGGIRPQPLLTGADLATGDGGGLIIVGSHVKKTTTQVTAARALPNLATLEIAVPKLLDPATRDAEIDRAVTTAASQLTIGRDVLVHTSREVVTSYQGAGALEIGKRVSSALVALVKRIPVRPAWMIAKGGITSSDVATDGLGIRQAYVLGQAIPGVPIWRTDPAGRWPDLTYVVFPGNVGGPDALAQMIQVLR